MTPIAPLIEAFLRETLSRQRGASRHTQDSYALSFQLLFVFAAGRLKVSPSALTLEHIDAAWSPPSSSTWRMCARTRP